MSRTAAIRKTAAAPAAAFPLPALATGQAYAGVLLKGGKLSHHLVLLPGENGGANWKDACAWAGKQDGELPTRKEQALLFANAVEHFQPQWYWSSEEYAGDAGYAWIQGFYDGSQDRYLKSNQFSARAVRRIPI